MQQLNFHNATDKVTPPQHFRQPPIIEKLILAYRVWHEYLPHFPKTSRYTLGGKIDSLFLEVTESLYIVTFTPAGQKLQHMKKACNKFDLLKFYLRVAWEIQAMETNQFAHLSKELAEVGKMLGGWNKQLGRL